MNNHDDTRNFGRCLLFAIPISVVLWALIIFGISEAFAHHHHYHDEPVVNDTGGGGGGGDKYELNTAGAAIAGAAGTCVRDWTKGMQYCGSWAMVDGDDYDKAVHAFGGGVTTRVDTFALSFYGGVENLDKDSSTYMLTGSINWR